LTGHRVAVIPGDNVGPEVIREGLGVLGTIRRVLAVDLEWDSFAWGSEYYRQFGQVMPSDGLDTLSRYEAIYLGAVGDPARVPDRIMSWGLVQPVRKAFEQYVNVRPITLIPGVQSPLRIAGEIDYVIVRENTEGEYAGVGGRIHKGHPSELATQTSIFTREGVQRVMRYAFQLARRRNGKKLVTSATKSNALNHSMVFWDEVFEETSEKFADVSTERVHVDALSMHLVTKPGHFDVIVASNLFGDILSDLGAATVGGIGLAPGANLNPERQFPSMFEPIHGSAPDIAGRGLANPIGSIAAAGLMLEFLGETLAARLVRSAIEAVLREGAVRTPDLGGTSSTGAMGAEVCKKIQELASHRAEGTGS